MSGWEILFIGVALSMDAFAVGITDGMAEPRMRGWKVFMIAFVFTLFQFGMPLLGYFLGAAFTELVEKIAPYLSFALLFVLGGKMIFDCIKEKTARKKECRLRSFLIAEKEPIGAGRLFVQAVATSLDALAVGVTLLAAETGAGLPASVWGCALVIGAVTFSLSVIAVNTGKKTGGKFSDDAGLLGGAILIIIGIKILLEGII